MADDGPPRSAGTAVHLCPRGDDEALIDAVSAMDTTARRWVRHIDGLVNPGPHVAVLEYDGDGEAIVERAGADLDELGPLVDRIRSFVMVGHRLAFRPAPIPPLRYWYGMTRRADFDHDSYLRRYREVHSAFGMETTGIEGYTQWHGREADSAAAARQLGLGPCPHDSISVLDIADLDRFFTAAASSDIGTRATEDETRFVDRPASHDLVLALVGDDRNHRADAVVE